MNQRTMICAGRVTTGPERKKRVHTTEEKASQKINYVSYLASQELNRAFNGLSIVPLERSFFCWDFRSK